MSFRVDYLEGSGNYEVVMQAGTLRGRVNYPKSAERRMAMCSHENDAQVIADALNAAEKNGTL